MALVWLMPVLWTVNYIIARKAPGVVGPYLLAFGRWSIAAILLLVIARAELWQQRRYLAQVWWHYLVLGFLGMVVCGAWVYQGAHTTSAVNIALIYAAAPVLIALGAVFWLGERLSRLQLTGIVLALAGMLHVILKGHWLTLSALQFSTGDLWILAATVSWAAYALLQKRWPSPLGSTARLAAIGTGGSLLLLPMAAVEASLPGAAVWTGQALLLIVLAALLPGLAAYWIYGWAQKIIGANRVAMSLYLGPLYAAFAAWALLGERPGLHHLVGALLILPGIYLVTRQAATAR